MTDDEREQLLSDALDGVASEADLARIDADADLRFELGAMRRAQRQLAESVPTIDPAIRDSMISAALDELTPAATPETTPAPVIDLAAQRARRQRRLNLVGAAAAVVLVAGAGVAAVRSGGNSGDSDSTAADAVADEGTEDQAMQGESEPEAGSRSNDEEELTVAASDDAGGSDGAASMMQDEVSPEQASDFAEGSLESDDALADEDFSDEESAESEEEDLAESAPAPTAIPLIPTELEPCRDAVEELLDPDTEPQIELDDGVGNVREYVVRIPGEELRFSIELDSCAITPIETP